MSMVYIIEHSENIYDLGKSNVTKIPKPNKYRSIFQSQVKAENSARKGSRQTMGYPETLLQTPKNFLRKNQGIHMKKKPGHKCDRQHYLPPIPKRNESAQQKDEKSDKKNFRVENIKKVTQLIPRKPKPRFVDSRMGDFHEVFSSGLMPAHIYSPKYGKIPNYIIKRSEEKCKHEMKIIEEYKQKLETPDMSYVASDERIELLKGLKRNWEELQKTYLGLPVFTDTLPKKMHKTKLEKELKQLEQDIMLLENNPHIYIW